MKNAALPIHPARPGRRRLRRHQAFTMFEVLLVVIALGLLAALIVPTIERFIDATSDTAKTHNAKILNQYVETLYNAGAETNWADGAAAITALTAGVSLPPTVPGGQTQIVKLTQAVNAEAYTYTAGTPTSPPSFSPLLGRRNVRP